MLFGLHRALKAGETITFTLVFEKGGEVTVPFEVRDARSAAPAPMRGH
jgi:copper(I)-binding protein